jgi:hypothetical protein
MTTDPAEQGRKLKAAGVALQLEFARQCFEAGVATLRAVQDDVDRAVEKHADTVESVAVALGNIAGEKVPGAKKVRATEMTERVASKEIRDELAKAKAAEDAA